jgi:hypothetical protein
MHRRCCLAGLAEFRACGIFPFRVLFIDFLPCNFFLSLLLNHVDLGSPDQNGPCNDTQSFQLDLVKRVVVDGDLG